MSSQSAKLNICCNCSNSTIMSQSDSSFFQESNFEDEGSEETHTVIKVRVALSRTSVHLQEHKEFIAARAIQARARGWLARHMMAKKAKAVRIIENKWKNYYRERKSYADLQEKLQQTVLKHYDRKATMIQALWRGYWSRRNKHDHTHLIRLQVDTAEDLLHCVAYKLHHLMRTRQIPGIFSLRNTTNLSIIEKLLASLNFRLDNTRSHTRLETTANDTNEARKLFNKSTYGTKVPYYGPNNNSVCEDHVYSQFKSKEGEKRMYSILKAYEAANKLLKPQTQKCRKTTKADFKTKRLGDKVKDTDFCGDVIKSMKRWRILADNGISIDANIFKKPKNLENFLKEVRSIYGTIMNERCHCNRNPIEECHARPCEQLFDFDDEIEAGNLKEVELSTNNDEAENLSEYALHFGESEFMSHGNQSQSICGRSVESASSGSPAASIQHCYSKFNAKQKQMPYR